MDPAARTGISLYFLGSQRAAVFLSYQQVGQTRKNPLKRAKVCAEDSSLCVILTTRNDWACLHLGVPISWFKSLLQCNIVATRDQSQKSRVYSFAPLGFPPFPTSCIWFWMRTYHDRQSELHLIRLWYCHHLECMQRHCCTCVIISLSLSLPTSRDCLVSST